MTNQYALAATTDRPKGSRANRRLRREGKLPGVVYGLGQDAAPVVVNYRETRLALSQEAGLNALLNLEVDGDTQLCIVKDIQRHPVRDEVMHIDFLRVDPDQEVEVSVPLTLVGEAREVANENGMVDQALFQITVLSKPAAIPNELEIDISDLTVGDAKRIADLALPEGVRTEMDPEEAIAIAVITRSTLDALAAEEAAAAAALLEDEGGAPAAGGDGADGDADGAGDDEG